MGIARYYDETKNPEGAQLYGVPLRDLTEEEYDELPKHLQRSVDASSIYRKTKPRQEPAERSAPAPKRRGSERADAAEGETLPDEISQAVAPESKE